MLNILTIHAIRNTLSLPKPLQTLLLSLAVSDLGVGLLAQPLFIALMVNPTNSTRTTFNIIVLLFGNAVHLHLRYQELVTHKRVVTAVILIWILCVSLPFILMVSSKKLAIMLLVTLSEFCFIITALVYSSIYFTVKHHRHQIQVQQVQVAQNVQNS